MSFELEPPLINILGMSRYDLPAPTINNTTINNWQKAKNKLCLTPNEHNLLLKEMKISLNIVLTEQISGSGITLKLNKPVSSKKFNDVLRNFINTHKICKKCKCPELRDGNCNGCGFSLISKSDDDIKVTEPKKTLTKQEKRALKVKAQLLKNTNKENSDDEFIESNTDINITTVNNDDYTQLIDVVTLLDENDESNCIVNIDEENS
jgi:hypothetical protein